jgi:hypothetical protein
MIFQYGFPPRPPRVPTTHAHMDLIFPTSTTFFLPARSIRRSARAPLSTWSARVSLSTPFAQLQLESVWCGSTVLSHTPLYVLFHPFLVANIGRVALLIVCRVDERPTSSATNIRQGYAYLFPPFHILLR